MTIEVFYSYARKDQDLRDELDKHLSMLRREGLIVGWHDKVIGPGEEWRKEIDAHLDSAQIILLLISADFLASDFCYGIEVKRALERHERNEAIVVPIILRSADWKSSPFGRLNALPRDAKPVRAWPNPDDAFLDIALGLREVVRRLTEPRLPQIRRLPPIEGASVTRRPGLALPHGVFEDVVPAQRFMDAAIASHVVKGHPTELDVLVRLPNSPGLKGILAEDGAADAAPEDTVERPFELTFARRPDGTLEPRQARAVVIAPEPDFEPREQHKDFLILPTRDSERLTFFLTPRRTGRLKILVELHWSDVLQAPRRLVTECVADASNMPARPGKNVVHVPIGLVEDEEPRGRGIPLSLGLGAPYSADPPSGPATATPYPDLPAPAERSSFAPRALVFAGVPALLVAGVAGVVFGTMSPAETLADCLLKTRATAVSSDVQALERISAPNGGSIEFKGQSIATALAKDLSDDLIRAGMNACREKYVSNAAPLARPTLLVTATVKRGSEVREVDVTVTANLGTTKFGCTRPTDRNGECDLLLPELPAGGSVRLEAYRAGMFLARTTFSVEDLLHKGTVDLVRDRQADPIVVDVAASDCKSGSFNGHVEVSGGDGLVWDAQRATPPSKFGEGRRVVVDTTGRARFNAIVASLPDTLTLTLEPHDGRNPHRIPIAASAFHDTVSIKYPCSPPVAPAPLPTCDQALTQRITQLVWSHQAAHSPGDRHRIRVRGSVDGTGRIRAVTTSDGPTPENKQEAAEIGRRVEQLGADGSRPCRFSLVSN